jgi:hypothetical protein
MPFLPPYQNGQAQVVGQTSSQKRQHTTPQHASHANVGDIDPLNCGSAILHISAFKCNRTYACMT